MYGTPVNGTSLDDEFSDLAVIDSMFPGVLIPDRVWSKFNQTIINNITKSTSVNVTCNQTERIYNTDFSFCYAESVCSAINNKIFDVYLYFNATRPADDPSKQNYTEFIFSMKKSDYAIKWMMPYIDDKNVSQTKEVCKFLIYGQNGSSEKRYLVGNSFLNSYYVAFNYTQDRIGFNGDYWRITNPLPGPKNLPDNAGSPLIIILIIAGALLFVAIGVCIYIKKRNEKLQSELHHDTKYSSLH